MKKESYQGLVKSSAVCLLCTLALTGCDDVKDLIEGKTKVFTVTGAQISSKLGTLDPGYYDISAVTNATREILLRQVCQ